MDKPRASRLSLDVIALVLLVIETVAALAISVGYAVYALLDDEMSGLAVALAIVIGVMAVGLAIFTWGFARRKRFALGGVVTWQLMQLSVGVSVFPAVPLVAIALIVTAVLVAWAAMRRLSQERGATSAS